jgi:ribosomal protein S18 acetylase RimI-like enzyme
MTMRLIKLPTDLIPLTEVVTESFQYPENENWSVQTDEKEMLVDSMKYIRRLWPLIRLIQILSPPLRDILRGYVWEEDGQVVGITIAQRRGSTDVWIIGTVGVLPGYRRRGIAKKLVEATLGLIRERGGGKAVLSVIEGNHPAYTLYQELGFEHFSGNIEFHSILESTPSEPDLPEGYIRLPLSRFDWEPRYELEKRISPENMLKYEPVEPGRFRQPAMMRLLWPIIMYAQGMRVADFIIQTVPEDQIVAQCGYNIPRRGKGVNILRGRLDSAHPMLASYIVQYLLHEVATISPGFRTEFSVPNWMGSVISAVEEAGFNRRLGYHRMGIEL